MVSMMSGVHALSALCFAFAAISVAAVSTADSQVPLGSTESPLKEVKEQLILAEIIPTVIDESFTPKYLLNITWPQASGSDVNAELGNTLDPPDLQKVPDVRVLSPSASDDRSTSAPYSASSANVFLAITDPDAPARDRPVWSQVCHFLAYVRPDESFTSPQHLISSSSDNVDRPWMKILMPYKAPGPPPKTGKHRYVFTILLPTNGTSKILNPTRPIDRPHWGYSNVRVGLQEWATENGLQVVAVNFIYAQNGVQ